MLCALMLHHHIALEVRWSLYSLASRTQHPWFPWEVVVFLKLKYMVDSLCCWVLTCNCGRSINLCSLVVFSAVPEPLQWFSPESWHVFHVFNAALLVKNVWRLPVVFLEDESLKLTPNSSKADPQCTDKKYLFMFFFLVICSQHLKI